MIVLILSLTGFKHPESVVYGDGALYISDVGEFGVSDGKIWKVEGGSRRVFCTGLKDPKGLAWFGGSLFVADVDRVWKVDKSGVRSLLAGPKAFPTEPKFLNGMAVDDAGYLYVSDTFTGWVYRVDARGGVVPLCRVDKPNGLTLAPDGTLYIITFTNPGNIYAYKEGQLRKVLSSTELAGGDGLVWVDGVLYASGYQSGKVCRVDPASGQLWVIKEGLTTPADINISSSRVLWVPLLEAGEVIKLAVGP